MFMIVKAIAHASDKKKCAKKSLSASLCFIYPSSIVVTDDRREDSERKDRWKGYIVDVADS